MVQRADAEDNVRWSQSSPEGQQLLQSLAFTLLMSDQGPMPTATVEFEKDPKPLLRKLLFFEEQHL